MHQFPRPLLFRPSTLCLTRISLPPIPRLHPPLHHYMTFLTSQKPGLASLTALAFSADVTATTRPASPLTAATTSANSLVHRRGGGGEAGVMRWGGGAAQEAGGLR